MPQIKKYFLQENTLPGQTLSPESNFDIKIIRYFKQTILLKIVTMNMVKVLMMSAKMLFFFEMVLV